MRRCTLCPNDSHELQYLNFVQKLNAKHPRFKARMSDQAARARSYIAFFPTKNVNKMLIFNFTLFCTISKYLFSSVVFI